MRLYDQIISLVGSSADKATKGSISNLAICLAKAEAFELSDEIYSACFNLCYSKPSSILSAITHMRSPYQSVWIEWRPRIMKNMRINQEKNTQPKKMGCLISCLADTSNMGQCIWAWSFDDADQLVICPYSYYFDWSEASDFSKLKEWFGKKNINQDFADKLINDKLGNVAAIPYPTEKLPTKWDKYENIESEQSAIERMRHHVRIGFNEVCIEYFFFLQDACKKADREDYFHQLKLSWHDDIIGEMAFIEAFIMMLNSKNIIDKTKDDFSKLNKSRAKSKKAPLKEFVVTRLSMSRVVHNRLHSSGMTREEARQHLVMGHFKIRRTGVYWWSPFVRNRSRDLSIRSHYQAVSK